MHNKEDIIEEILKIAVNAPSGDNAQPWEFEVQNGKVSLFNVRGKDATLYNFRERGSYVAHGAVIENIFLLASKYSCAVDIKLFPDPKNHDLVASISFIESKIEENRLHDFILKRITNRKPYAKKPLKTNDREDIVKISREFGDLLELKLVEDRATLKLLGKLISLNERLILENKYIHDFLFSIIRWSKEEERVRAGMYIKTFELPRLAQSMFRLFRNWSIVKKLNMIKFYRFLQLQTSKLYESSSAIGIIVIDQDSDENFINVGRFLQRTWLKATSLDLSLQPVTAIAYLGQRIFAGDTKYLSPVQITLIQDAYKKISDVFEVKKGTIAMIFRIGYDGVPSAQSYKFPPKIAIKN